MTRSGPNQPGTDHQHPDNHPHAITAHGCDPAVSAATARPLDGAVQDPPGVNRQR